MACMQKRSFQETAVIAEEMLLFGWNYTKD